MATEKIITHPILGQYTQKTHTTPEEAGHRILGSEGKYGWQMPMDSATSYILTGIKDQNIVDLGCGMGETITIPALNNGANHLYALDVTPSHVDDQSLIALYSRENSIETRLTRALIGENWWHAPLNDSPSINDFFGFEKESLDINGNIDLVVARHSLQFGTPHSFLRSLDFVSYALRPGGIFCGINFTPLTEYIFKYDNGITMQKILESNYEFSQGRVDIPGGYLDRLNGPLGITLKQLIQRSDIAEDNGVFTYLDEPTIIGLISKWKESRKLRNLPSDLNFVEGFYFSPDNITSFNKLVSGPEKFHNMENYLFKIIKN